MPRLRAGVIVVVAAAALLGGWRLDATRRANDRPWRVVEVVDGDTIVARRGGRTETVRLLGVDTPETKDPDRPVECFGPEATAFTEARLAGALVRLETDTQERDDYGRLLAYVRLDGVEFNEVLLRAGYARLLVIPPNDRHGRALLRAELDARARARGLWAVCESG